MDNLQLNCQDADILSHSAVYKVLIFIKGLMNIAAVVIFVLLAMSKQNVGTDKANVRAAEGRELALTKPAFERPKAEKINAIDRQDSRGDAITVNMIQAKIFHPNTKVVALSVCTFTFLMALQDSCFYTYELWRMTYPYSNPCNRLWTTIFIFISRTVHVTFKHGINSSLVVLCIERITCICRISNYEQSSKPILVAVLLTVITAVSSIGFTLFYMSDIEWNEGMASTTARNKMDADKYQIVLYFLFVMEILGVFCFLFIHNWSLWYRKRIRGFKTLKQRKQLTSIQSSQPLSVKFQIEETIRMTSLFLPVVLCRCSFSIYSFISASISNAIWPKPSIDFQMVTFELTHISHMLPFFITLLLAHGVGKLRKVCCFSHHSVQEITDTTTGQTQDDYFKRLNQLFEVGDPKMVKQSPKPQFNNPEKNSRVFWTSRVSDSYASMS